MKPKFNSYLLAAFATIMLFSATTWLSCTKNICASTTCYNGGVCNNGKCTCATGYEGANCNTASRQKFIYNWDQIGSDTSTTGATQTYALDITTGDDITSLQIINFDNYFTVPVTANVSSADMLNIPYQVVQGYTISGSIIYLSNGNLSVSYSVISPSGVSKNIKAVWNK